MKFWQSMSFVDTEELVPIARVAEDVGFEGLLVSNHLALPEKFDHAYPYTLSGDPGFPPAGVAELVVEA